MVMGETAGVVVWVARRQFKIHLGGSDMEGESSLHGDHAKPGMGCDASRY